MNLPLLGSCNCVLACDSNGNFLSSPLVVGEISSKAWAAIIVPLSCDGSGSVVPNKSLVLPPSHACAEMREREQGR